LITGLDHIPIVVLDLEKAVETYRGLGFTIKPGLKHENGIKNAHIKFHDGTELELVSVPSATDALAREYRRLLEEGEGPAFVSFYAPDLGAVSAKLDAMGQKHTETPTMVTFPENDPLRYIFFGNRQKSPTDKPEHFAHPLLVISLNRVWIAADNVTKEIALLRQMGSQFAPGVVELPSPVRNTFEDFPDGQVAFFPSSYQTIKGRRVIGVTLLVEDIRRVKTWFSKFLAPFANVFDNSVLVRPEQTHGLWIEYREASG